MHLGKQLLLGILVLAVYLMHQDFWNWTRYEPMLFGFLPVGLSYHAIYSLVAAVTMAILVWFAWPSNLEDVSALPHSPNSDEIPS